MRVLVLGAGASRHAAYPLAAEMGKCLAAWVTTQPPDYRYRSCVEEITDLYGSLDNFEVILADLMTCPSGSRAERLGGTRTARLRQLTEAIRDHFDAMRSTPAPQYDRLVRILHPGDVVITFNYDLGIERALRAAELWNIENGYGFPIADVEKPSPVEVLKLHGSTNWQAIVHRGMNPSFHGVTFASNGSPLGDRPIMYYRSDLDYLGYQDFVDPLCVGLGHSVTLPAMIMPALPKHFHFETNLGDEWKLFWRNLWWRAECAIQAADEVVVAGYSMPDVDQQAQKMLLETQNKSVRLSVCCREKTREIRQKFRDKEFSRVQDVAPDFEDFLRDAGAGEDTPTSQPLPARAKTQETTRLAESTTALANNILAATARLRDDGLAVYSQENSPIQDRLLRLDQLQVQLTCLGAYSNDIDRFVSTLLATGFAEMRREKLLTKFFTMG